MGKWKIFGKSKKEEETANINQATEEMNSKASEEKSTEEQTDQPIAEYHETLHTSKKASNSKTISHTSSNVDQRVWRDVDSIETNVDTINIKKAQKSVTEVDKKVDQLIEKNKTKHKRTPSNVIYVVSKPQPGEVKGDWAVRSHGKIFSHHKTKEKAIEEARKIAMKREATVMIQNTDGTFSDGFKPRTKK